MQQRNCMITGRNICGRNSRPKMSVEEKYLNWLRRDKYQGQEVSVEKLDQDLKRLKKGEPIDYVIGWRVFLGCKIDLSEKPLIPREETEYWVKVAIDEIKKELKTKFRKKSSLKILDIFSGSGCIGLAILSHLPQARVTFADKNFKALATIKKNLKINKMNLVQDRAQVIKSDVWSNLPGQFDVVLANPPYIPNKKRLPRSVSDFEPKNALFGGKDGLYLMRIFLNQAKKHLTKNGKIYLEFGFGQKSAVEKILKMEGFSDFKVKKDQFGRYRFAVIKNSR